MNARARWAVIVTIAGSCLGAEKPALAQQLDLGHQMLPSYAPAPYSPVFPGYEPAPRVGGYQRIPDAPPPAYQPPSYPPRPSYPQYLPNNSGMAGSTFDPPY